MSPGHSPDAAAAVSFFPDMHPHASTLLEHLEAVAQASVVTPYTQQANESAGSVSAQNSQPKITGQTVVITGGSQGVGRVTALLFAQNGYNVVIAARNPDKLRATEAELVSAATRGSICSALSTDITDETAVARLVEDVTSKYENVSILINCAGVCLNGTLESTSIADFVDQMNVNFLGAVIMTKGFQPALVAAAKKGMNPVLVNVNSFGGRIPLRSMPAYTASKYALAGFTDAIRPDFADQGVHVAQVHPGVVKSNFMERAAFRGPKGEEQRATMERMLEQPPPGLVQTPQEVAAQIYSAVQNRKDEVFVGPAYNTINALYRSLGVNPFSVAT
ncbi:probable oxidoreductase EphD [Coccomyxa sp. Obi]|nr:probable oxidoreductase EphD [Coccomyxa sp. Obi]